ncbi:uncharacterized protein BDV14DRAFT_186907 [Aspergillus stella-maris]|uniref:uncharacterized protein n=1 Tax=Aspergillus stella-maris TaxID=1810926 RepID=UPI003CCE378C
MRWSQISPTRWERPLNGLETYFWFTGQATASVCGGREHFLMFSTVKVGFNLLDVRSSLRDAWKQLRHDEPELAVTFEGDKKVYEVPVEAELETWLDAAFVVVSNVSDAEEFYQTFTREYKQTTLYYIPASSELILFTHHAIIDGIGLLMFWDKFFTALASPKSNISFGEEHTRLNPTVDEILGYSAPSPKATEKATAMIMNDYTARLPAIGLPSGVGKTVPGGCRHIEHRFSPETTEAIVTACKKRGISVTPAVHAAYIRVLMENADLVSNSTRYTSSAEFNFRPYLPDNYKNTAVANYYSPYALTTKLPASHTELAQTLNMYYTTIKGNPEYMEMAGPLTQTLAGLVQSPAYQTAPIPTDALVSSIGVVEQYLKRGYGSVVTVKDYKLNLDIVLGMSLINFYTFGGELRLMYNFNEGYEKPEDIQGYLGGVEKVLRVELLGETQ